MDSNIIAEKLNTLNNLLLKKYGDLVSIPAGNLESIENAIEAIDNYYDKIISHMPGNVYWLDGNATCIGCNKNVLDMFGLTSVKQFRGLSFEEMGQLGNWTPAATQSFKNDTLEVVRTGQPRLGVEEPPIPHADGRVIYFLTSRVPVFDTKGSVIAVVGISIDITDRKEMEIALKAEKEKAELANRTKSEFIKNMSHDVKTPLSGIIGMANLLTKAVDEKQRIECATSIEEAAQQLMTFFENCLDMSRADTREVIFVKESFNLKNLLNQLAQLFQPSIKNKGLVFAIEYPEDMPQSFIGSSAAIYRVLLNLIGNAIKFTHDGSIKISVSYSQGNPSKNMVKLAVEDTGIGIPAEKQKLIFEQYTRIFPSYEGIYEGAGIGLYLVEKFVKAMEGEIQLESQEGKGSRFSIFLPLEVSNTLQEESTNKLASTPNTGPHPQRTENIDQPIKILVVEDQPIAQKVAESILISLGCEVDVADCGEKALSLFALGKYDLIFMDIGLPDMSGYEVSKKIREMEKITSRHTPIVALTAHAKEDAEDECSNAGIKDLISKPLNEQKAKEIMGHYISGKAPLEQQK